MAYITGKIIREMREKKKLTQRELASLLSVSDKTISKWETDKGLPDITILDDLSRALDVSIAELLTGDIAINHNRSGNMKRSRFYICPLCGNIIHAMGDGVFSCCGIRLPAEETEQADHEHLLQVETIEGEWYVHCDHPMTKDHYISFIACITDDTIQLCKLYPEQNCEAYFRRSGPCRLVVFCNRHGLMAQ